jgi:hypothetical protein
MRNCFAAFILILPALALAQFQPPTQDELKMTSDPKAPGAAAIYLNVEEIANDPLHFQSVYMRIKVLAEKGKELATVEIPYARGRHNITNIRGRTIHADGTIIPLVVKPEDLLVAKAGDASYGKKVFTLPSVEVGSILEYFYDERYDDDHFSSPSWEIQREYPVRKARYVFTPFKGFMPGSQNATSMYLIDENGNPVNTLLWWPVLPQGLTVKADAQGHYKLEVTDIPATPNEEWMPPEFSFRYKVLFYYKNAHTSQEFWSDEYKRWSRGLDRFAEPSPRIHEAVSGIIAPEDSELDKAKKLYKAVETLDNTDYSRKKTQSELKQLKLKEAKHAEDTWAQKSGNSEDIALLYLAMARAAGLKATASKVVNRERGLFDPRYLEASQLDDTLVILTIAGKSIELDPGEKMCPFGTVNWYHSYASGLGQAGDANHFTTSNGSSYPSNKITRFADISVDTQGTVNGSIRIQMTGQDALRWRQMDLRNDEAEVKKSFDQWLEPSIPEGITAHVDRFLGLDDPESILLAVIKVEGSLGAATAKRLMLPGFFFETRSAHPFVSVEKRLTDVDMHFGNIMNDQVTYQFPAEMSVEGAPATARIAWEGHEILSTKSVPSPGKVVIVRVLTRAFTYATAAEYQDLRGFYQKVAASDQQQLVLTLAAPAKGN